MAAPSNTVWGSIVNEKAKLGISVTATSTTNTSVTLNVQVWLALKWNISDSSNKYYFTYTNDSGTSVTSPNGTSLSLSFGTTSGSGWAEASQKQIGSYTLSYTKGTSAKTINFSSKITGLGSDAYTVSASTSYSVPKLTSYTISYNANGGSGAPSSQTKYYGKTLTLSSTKPTRTNYTFLGWGTSSSATTATYSAGGSYTANASATLYAVWTQSSTVQTIMARYQNTDGSWGSYEQVYSAALSSGATCSWSQAETNEFEAASISYTVSGTATKYVDVNRKQYTVSFDANGGKWNPPTITYYYGGNLYLTKRPTRSGYEFIGWSLSSSATETTYTTNSLYDTEDTSNPTYYAVWSKYSDRITGFGNNGEIYASSVVEETLDNGNFAIGSDFIADKLSEGKFYKYYLVDSDGNQLVDNDGNYLFEFVEDGYNIITDIVWDVELLSSDGYVLTDSNGIKLIAGRNE